MDGNQPNPATADATLGPNSWLVDEMRDQFETDPTSVPDEWADFFRNGSSTSANGAAIASSNGSAAAAASANGAAASANGQSLGLTAVPAAEMASDAANATPVNPAPAIGAAAPAAAAPTPTAPVSADVAEPTAEPAATTSPLRGAAARIVENMERSLDVPTATSFRDVPAKLLEINRRVINGHLGRTRGSKVSFTHIIGYAIVRAIADHVPAMMNTFETDADGKPLVNQHPHVNLGLAIDLEKRGGGRSLVVPKIAAADTLNFGEFCEAYDGIVRRAKSNKLTPDEFADVTVTLTNPGTIGTKQSVPRLMPGQAVIVGVGSMSYPAEWMGADARTIAKLGISKVMTMTSTYDHRIIQGAESGVFLKKVEELLLGADEFYERLFADVGVPYVAVKWLNDNNTLTSEDDVLEKQMGVATLINMYRSRGHLIAALDPLSARAPEMHPELDPAAYGLTIWDLDREFLTGSTKSVYAPVGGSPRLPLGEILRVLRDAYCRTIGIEYMHISEVEEKRWIQEQVERELVKFSADEQIGILDLLNKAEALEHFLGTKYLGQKRFGLEGGESAIAILHTLLGLAADRNFDSAFVGMAHRGRLNVLVNVMNKSYGELFAEFEDYLDEDDVQGSGDVKYHLGQTSTFTSPAGNEVRVSLAPNPSHLETVSPIVEGMVRARMDKIVYDPERKFPVLPLLIHGDAAFAGQGVVAETLNLSNIKGYRVGGTVHVVINNQLGFTTPPESARSSEYCTDIAKMVQAPIFHVNGDDPEACVRVAQLAFEYRAKFHKDVVIDMVCYRRRGHNESDDPSYTQPLMYKRIEALAPVRELYSARLVRSGDLPLEIADQAREAFQTELNKALESVRSFQPTILEAPPQPASAGVLPHVGTAVSKDVLDRIFDALNASPDDFQVHPKLLRQFHARNDLYHSGEVDWALAEAMAFGSLLAEGTSVRLAGQDSRRGTFSHRHSTLVDYTNGAEYVPLEAMCAQGSSLWIYDSLLSEYAALGFEYGYALESPKSLVMWEAQFGDFFNGAQIIVDQYLVAAEDKWKQLNGLVMLLPHGYEGQGPEHSSARIERFMVLAAEDNIQLCNATTAAQYFHLLRRQLQRETQRPLVIFTPKSGLRAKNYRSRVEDLTSGTFEELLSDTGQAPPETVTRLILVSGKIAHEAIDHRDANGLPVAVARVEQLFPWPFDSIEAEVARFPNLKEIVWLQEEPENMGPWNGIKGRLYERFENTHHIQRVSRHESGSPATGSKTIHEQEQRELLRLAFADVLEP